MNRYLSLAEEVEEARGRFEEGESASLNRELNDLKKQYEFARNKKQTEDLVQVLIISSIGILLCIVIFTYYSKKRRIDF